MRLLTLAAIAAAFAWRVWRESEFQWDDPPPLMWLEQAACPGYGWDE